MPVSDRLVPSIEEGVVRDITDSTETQHKAEDKISGNPEGRRLE